MVHAVFVQQGATSTPRAEVAEVKVEVKQNSVVLHSTQITGGELNKVDISFTPKTVWGKQLTTSQLMERKQKRRQRLSDDVDLDDLRMPFNKNIQKMFVELLQYSE